MHSNSVHDRNRAAWNLPTSVEPYEVYSERQGLTWCEERLVEKYLSSGVEVLDIGIGTGRTTAVLKPLASRYVGIDYSEPMIAHCRERFPDAELYVQDARDLSRFDSASFDAVLFSFNGIDLMSDEARKAFLSECHRVLRQGGTFIFSTHNPRGLIQLANPSYPPARGLRLGLRYSLGYGLRSFLRKRHLLRRRGFWLGEGWVPEPPFLIHMSSRRRVLRELGRFEFKPRQTVSCAYPRRSVSLTTSWYYYAFTRP